jgi:transposase
VVPQNFLACDRDQELLLPPSLRDWLGEDHLAWCVLDAVEQIDLSGIYGAYRADGWGRAAFDPQMMVALLLYAYAVGERSSQRIERRCVEDVAFRVISTNQAPDHATIARFRARHEQALADLFTDVLELCAKAGLVSVGLVALDGTKIAANAALCQTKTYASINTEMRQILEQAADADAQEDGQFGVGSRGDELPAELADRSSRRARLERCKAELESEPAERDGGCRIDPQQWGRGQAAGQAECSTEIGGGSDSKGPAPGTGPVRPSSRWSNQPKSTRPRGAASLWANVARPCGIGCPAIRVRKRSPVPTGGHRDFRSIVAPYRWPSESSKHDRNGASLSERPKHHADWARVCFDVRSLVTCRRGRGCSRWVDQSV